MKRHILVYLLLALCILLAACGQKDSNGNKTDRPLLEDGTYKAEFDSDSSMFHVNEAHDGCGILTVKDGKMTLHISLASKKITRLYYGTVDEMNKGGKNFLEPTLDTVTYSDGMQEEVYGFDVPVPFLDEEFDLALLGSKDNWYDHKVKVSNPVLMEK